jgi:5'-methylthioadenosine phosphorylase
MDNRIGVIGGSGIYTFEGVKVNQRLNMDTPFGKPSAPLIMAEYNGVPLVFLPRHGEGHTLSPSEVPYAANIYALKHVGVRQLISVSAVGSLQEKYHPRHFVIPDQIFDRTKGIRRSTYFGGGMVGHIGFGDPFCRELSRILNSAAEKAGATVHHGGTLVCMEGPAFSTRAESMVYRSQGHAIIGMTALPEAKLAREAGICYATLCMITDFDVWHETEDDVSVEAVVANVKVNTVRARKTLELALGMMDAGKAPCNCYGGVEGIENSIMTAPEHRSYLAKEHLKVILER